MEDLSLEDEKLLPQVPKTTGDTKDVIHHYDATPIPASNVIAKPVRLGSSFNSFVCDTQKRSVFKRSSTWDLDVIPLKDYLQTFYTKIQWLRVNITQAQMQTAPVSAAYALPTRITVSVSMMYSPNGYHHSMHWMSYQP
jgi:hypothetical protein